MKNIFIILCLTLGANTAFADVASDAAKVYAKTKKAVTEVSSAIEVINDAFRLYDIKSCLDLPTSGDTSDNPIQYVGRTDLFGAVDGAGTINMYLEYKVAKEFIPADFPNGDGTTIKYDKRFKVYFEFGDGIYRSEGAIEISCTNASGFVSQTLEDGEYIEINWNVDTANQTKINLKLATDNSVATDDIAYAVKFRQFSSNTYSLKSQSSLVTSDLDIDSGVASDAGATNNNALLPDVNTIGDLADAWTDGLFTFFDNL